MEDTEISLITKDAVVKRIRKAKAEVVEKVHTDVSEELDVAVEEDSPQKKRRIYLSGRMEFLIIWMRRKEIKY